MVSKIPTSTKFLHCNWHKMDFSIPDLKVYAQFNCFLSTFEFRKFMSLLGGCHSLN